ncbi:MAG: D-alanyl-D-alanine carboxypeptidase [Christensenellaceae bacterium]|jgi:D-alanyl-D-alanine carboxypeptidase|nr:D-alanyl-D-alanine carboxypeptidase [Christensenellaceae bacterium]
MRKISTLTRYGFARVVAFILALVMLGAGLASLFIKPSLAVQAKAYGYSYDTHNTTSSGMCVIDVDSGRILYEKNMNKTMGMASTTKIVTVITILEFCEKNGINLDEKITINDLAVGIEGSSIYLRKGERLTRRELLYGLMLRSGNDTAVALALSVAESVDKFAEMMNEFARGLNLSNFSFKNPHGLDHAEHFISAHDLAVISAYAMKNEDFKKIVSTKQIRVGEGESTRLLNNKNKLLKNLDGCVGVKTGFTKKCGRCFVGAREVNGATTVCVVLNCPSMWEDSSALLRAAESEFTQTEIVYADEIISDEFGVRALAAEAFIYPLSAGERERISFEINQISKGKDGAQNGEIIIELGGEEIGAVGCVLVK